MQHQQIKLKNKLQTLFIDAPGSTSASVQIWFRAGSALEQKSNEGIAHFLEHMFFKGTPTRPGAEIAHQVESFGGEVNAFTSFDYTCYYINTPNSKLNKTIDILLDMVANPQFKLEDLIPERLVVHEEYRRSIDSPGQLSFHKLQKSSFTKGYAHPVLGNEKTINNFTQEQLHEFRNNFYNLSNAILVVSGDLKKKDQFIKTIEKFNLPDGEPSIFPEFKLKKKPTIEVHSTDTRMAQLTMMIQAPAHTDDQAPAEDLAYSCLGHGETSRLYKSMVLDGALANMSSASTMFMAKGGIHFTRINFPAKNMKKVLAKLHKTLKEVAISGLEQKEIDKIKNQYIASKIYEKESLESYAFAMGNSYAQTGDIHSEDEFIQRIKDTSKTSVNNALKSIFERSVHLSLQLPKEEDLKKGKVQVQDFQNKMSKLVTELTKKDEKIAKSTVTSKHDPQVQVIKLKKGVSLLYRHNTMSPAFVMHAYLKGGLTEETDVTNGYHHLLASMFNKGYKKVSYDQLRGFLEDNSASLSGFAGKNAYGMTLHGLSDKTQPLVDHFFGSFMSPTLPADKLSHEKEMTLRAIDNQEEDPIRHCFTMVNDLLFNGHPYKRNLLGTEKNVKKISRKFLTDTHKENIQNKELLLTYCGNKELNEVLDLIAPYVQELKPRAEKKLNFKKYKPITGVSKYLHFDREQTQIYYGIPSGKLGNKENLYLKMLATHLSGQSSELFVEVRDRLGLCYSAQPVHFMALEGGYFGIYMASGYDKVTPAIAAIKKIIDNIKNNGLSNKEFSRIKTMIEGQNLLNVQTNDDYANIYSVPVLQNQGLDYYHDQNEMIRSLKHEEFQSNIKKILNKQWNTIIVGREDQQ